MKLNVIKKKASSLRELGREAVEIPDVSTLQELLTALTEVEYRKQHMERKVEVLPEEDIRQQAGMGRVSFGDLYNEERGDLEKAVQVMIQDYKDGLFRVYLNQEECTCLEEPLQIQDGDEVVLIRLVMLAGRLW